MPTASHNAASSVPGGQGSDSRLGFGAFSMLSVLTLLLVALILYKLSSKKVKSFPWPLSAVSTKAAILLAKSAM